MHHYVYRINFVEIPGVYFGSRTSKCSPDKDIKYLGSPETYKICWKLYTPIKTILVTDFETRTDAIEHEKTLIRQQWDRNMAFSLNAHIPGEKFHVAGTKRIQTKETRKKISDKMKGNKNCKGRDKSTYGGHSPETKEKISKALTGAEVPNERREKISKTNKTKLLDAEYRQKVYDNLAKGRGAKTKNFIGISPAQEIVYFTNAAQFCRDNPDLRLNRTLISACANGKRETHRGWRFSYADDIAA